MLMNIDTCITSIEKKKCSTMKDSSYQKADTSLIYLFCKYTSLPSDSKASKLWISGNILQRQSITESRGRMSGNISLIQSRGSSNRALMMWNIMVPAGELYRISGKYTVKSIVQVFKLYIFSSQSKSMCRHVS